jgi:hypothetical protein
MAKILKCKAPYVCECDYSATEVQREPLPLWPNLVAARQLFRLMHGSFDEDDKGVQK